MIKSLDWNAKKEYAERCTTDGLIYALADCIECIQLGTDTGYYSDEASVYRTELKKRGLTIQEQDEKVKILVDKLGSM